MGQGHGAEDVGQGVRGRRPWTGDEEWGSGTGTPGIWEWTAPRLTLGFYPEELTCGCGAAAPGSFWNCFFPNWISRVRRDALAVSAPGTRGFRFHFAAVVAALRSVASRWRLSVCGCGERPGTKEAYGNTVQRWRTVA